MEIHEVQFFEATAVGGKEELYRFRQTINDWIKKNEGQIEIQDIKQNLVGKQSSHIYLVSIWYKRLEGSQSDQTDEGTGKQVENPFGI